MGLCWAISGLFPPFTAEMIDLYNIINIYIEINDSIFIDHILRKNWRGPNFISGSPAFSYREGAVYIITNNENSLEFQITPIDTLNECGPQSNLNFLVYLGFFFREEVFIICHYSRAFYRRCHSRYIFETSSSCVWWTICSLCYKCSNYHMHFITRHFSHTWNLSKNCACKLSASTAIAQRLGITDYISFHVQYRKVQIISWNNLRPIRIRCPFKSISCSKFISRFIFYITS